MKNEEKENYTPIDYRVKGDLESMKRKEKTNYNKIFYPLLGICLIISLFSLFLLNSSNKELKQSNEVLSKSLQIIDSLNSLNLNNKRIKWIILKVLKT